MDIEKTKKEFDYLYDEIIDKFDSTCDKENRIEAVKATAEIIKAMIVAKSMEKIANKLERIADNL